MDRYTEQNQEGGFVILWDNEEEIGLKFKKGDSLQNYTSSIVLKDWSLLQTGKALPILEEAEKRLTEEAKKRYPEEFKELRL